MNKIFEANISSQVCDFLKGFLKNISPEIIIEPTCGKGNFIIAALSNFKTIKKIFGVEIYKPYVWETKFNILNFFLSNPNIQKPEISILHSSVFDIDFKNISKQYKTEELLIIGNPPWVTNSELGSLNSTNLPKKSNFKNQNGLDAMTGKGNFDIAEYITLTLFDAFQSHKGHLALLVKNSVIKNIVFEQKRKQYRIDEIEKHRVCQIIKYAELTKIFCCFFETQNLANSLLTSIKTQCSALLILQQRKTAKEQVKMLSFLFDNPLLPQNNKPVMLDDTCYFIGFDKIEYAIYTLILLNSDKTEEFLKSITFYDAKRVFTKDILMRLNLLELAIKISQKEIKKQIVLINDKYNLEIKLTKWDSFIDEIKPKKEKQLKLF